MTRRSVRGLWVMAACLLGSVAPCLAQGGLPPEVIQAANIGPDQAAKIREFVQGPLQNLGSDDNDAVKEARNALLSNLRGQGISVSFRQEYSKQTLPRLQELSKGTRDQVASNAIRVVGELGTPEAVELLGQRLGDTKADNVRFMVTAQCLRVYELLDVQNKNQPAVLPSDLQSLTDKLGDRVLNEEHPDALDAAVRALIKATTLERTGFETVRRRATSVLCKQIIARSKTPNAWAVASSALPALLRGQNSLRDQLGVATALSLSTDEVKMVVTVHGQMITWIAENVREIGPGPTRQFAEQAVRVGETACVVGLEKLDSKYDSQNMADDFKAGTPDGDKKFFDKAGQLRRKLEAPPLNLGPFGRP